MKHHSRVLWFLLLYVVGLETWFVAWLTIGDQLWWLTLLNRVAPYLYLPLIPLILWSIRQRRRSMLVVTWLPLVSLAYIFWPYFVPRLTSPEPDRQLRVMTFNVLYSNDDYEAVTRIIQTYQPDLIALQEVRPRMMSELNRLLSDSYPYAMPGTENRFGTTAVFSRHPFTRAYVLDLETDRSAVVVEVAIDEQKIAFFSAHLLAYGLRWVPLAEVPQVTAERTRMQNRQATLLIHEMAQFDNHIVILGCDCNSTETSSSYRMISQQLLNAAKLSGWWFRMPAPRGSVVDRSLQHIDYVFYRGDMTAIGTYRIEEAAGSDHRPVVADFSFAKGPD